MMRNLFICLCLLFPGFCATAEEPVLRLMRALSDVNYFGEVGGLARDHRGFLWIGGPSGLFRYDGYELTPVRSLGASDSLVRIRTLRGEDDAGLWIGTDQGPFYFDPDLEQWSLVGGDDEVIALQPHKAGSAWVSSKNGLHLVDVTGSGQAPVRSDLEGVNCFVAGSSGILAGTDRGIFLLEDTGQSRCLWGEENRRRVMAMATNRSGFVWIGTDRGILTIDSKTWDEVSFAPAIPALRRMKQASISALLIAGDDHIWIGTERGLMRLNPRSGQYNMWPEDGSASHVLTLHEDAMGRIWVGTRDGLYYFESQWMQFQSILFSQEDPTVHAILQSDEHDLWLGTSAGLYKFDQHLRLKQHYVSNKPGSISHNQVSALLEDSSSRLWVGTAKGLNQSFDGGFRISGPGNSSIRALAEAPNKSLWVGTSDGLHLLEPDGGSFNRIGPDENKTGILSLLGQGEDVWVGTGDGLYLAHWGNPGHMEQRAVRGSAVFSMARDHAGQLWLGTSQGLLRYRGFTLFEIGPVTGLLPWENDLWVSSGRTIARFDVGKEHFRRFGKADGLRDNQYQSGAAFYGGDGTLYFGGIRGVDYFSPGEWTPPDRQGPVRYTTLETTTSEGKQTRPLRGTESQVTMGAHVLRFAVTFVSLDFSSDPGEKYAYTLEGFDPNWHESPGGRGRIEYNNLSAGNYTLKTKSTNPNGQWGEEAHLGLLVEGDGAIPPLFLLFCLLSLIGLLGLILKKRDRNTEKELEEFKSQIVANTSHELRTPLHGIIGLGESLLEESVGPLGEQVRENIIMMVSSGKRLVRLVDSILDYGQLSGGFVKLYYQTVDLSKLGDEVLAVCRPLTRKMNRRMILENHIPSDFPVIEADENRLQQILYNLVGNAVKFTEQGRITLHARQDGELVEVRVVDTGRGIPSDLQAHIFSSFRRGIAATSKLHTGTGLGLSITRQLVELLGGRIDFESKTGVGTTFRFTLPLKKADPS